LILEKKLSLTSLLTLVTVTVAASIISEAFVIVLLQSGTHSFDCCLAQPACTSRRLLKLNCLTQYIVMGTLGRVVATMHVWLVCDIHMSTLIGWLI